jgi:hypothetical protein
VITKFKGKETRVFHSYEYHVPEVLREFVPHKLSCNECKIDLVKSTDRESLLEEMRGLLVVSQKPNSLAGML